MTNRASNGTRGGDRPSFRNRSKTSSISGTSSRSRPELQPLVTRRKWASRPATWCWTTTRMPGPERWAGRPSESRRCRAPISGWSSIPPPNTATSRRSARAARSAGFTLGVVVPVAPQPAHLEDCWPALDGWGNEDSPTKFRASQFRGLQGPDVACEGGSAPLINLAYTGGIMPPPEAVAGTYVGPDGKKVKVAPLTDEDRRTLVRWIDLGCPSTWPTTCKIPRPEVPAGCRTTTGRP